MSEKLWRSILAVFLAMFMFGTSLNPAVYATGPEEETAEQTEPDKTAVQEVPEEQPAPAETAAEEKEAAEGKEDTPAEEVVSESSEPAETEETVKTEEAVKTEETAETEQSAEPAETEEQPAETGETEKKETVSEAEANDETDAVSESDAEEAEEEAEEEISEEAEPIEEVTEELTVVNDDEEPEAVVSDAPENAVAKITNGSGIETYYNLLDSSNPGDDYALAHWTTGTTLTLLKDINVVRAVEVSASDVTLDLNGCKLSTEENGLNERVKVLTGRTLTLIDSKGTGTITRERQFGGRGITVLGTLYLEGGNITGNSAQYSGMQDGAGIMVQSGGTVYMRGGTISGNTAMSNGGGVYVDGGTFTMTGGTISGNTANGASGGGGGIFVFSGSVTIASGTVSGNTTNGNGGGINVWGGTATIEGTGAVSDNTTGGKGGGVYTNEGSLTMTGGTISGNTAVYGGGVYDGPKNTTHFKLSGGRITNNTASSAYGGVFYDGHMFLSGDPEVSGNMTGSTVNNIRAGGKITIEGVLTGSAKSIGITKTPNENFTEGLSANNSNPEVFFSDDDNYVSAWNSSNTEAILKEKTPHAVTVDTAITNGTVTSDKEQATQGQTVTLTVTPAENYKLDELTVTADNSGDVIETKKTADSTYTFVMPDEAVTVSGVFNENILITIDFGADHSAYAETAYTAWKEALDHDSSWMSMFAKEIEYDDGSKITLRVDPEATYSSMNRGVVYSFPEEGDEQPYIVQVEEGEGSLVMLLLIGIGRSKLTSYADKAAFVSEYRGLEETTLRELNGETFMVLWAEPIETMDITCEPLICGTSVHTTGLGPESMQVPAPVLSYDKTLVERDMAVWTDPTDSESPFVFDVTGGKEYVLREQMMGSFGRIFTRDTEVTVNGVRMTYVSMDEGSGRLTDNSFTVMGGSIMILANIEAEHDWDEGKVTEKPACKK